MSYACRVPCGTMHMIPQQYTPFCARAPSLYVHTQSLPFRAFKSIVSNAACRQETSRFRRTNHISYKNPRVRGSSVGSPFTTPDSPRYVVVWFHASLHRKQTHRHKIALTKRTCGKGFGRVRPRPAALWFVLRSVCCTSRKGSFLSQNKSPSPSALLTRERAVGNASLGRQPARNRSRPRGCRLPASPPAGWPCRRSETSRPGNISVYIQAQKKK